jgi:hypothetical protein
MATQAIVDAFLHDLHAVETHPFGVAHQARLIVGNIDMKWAISRDHGNDITMAAKGTAARIGCMWIMAGGTGVAWVAAIILNNLISKVLCIPVTFFAQFRGGCNRFVVACGVIKPGNPRYRHLFFRDMAGCAVDTRPLFFRDQWIPLCNPDRILVWELARYTIRWRIDFGRGIPIGR